MTSIFAIDPGTTQSGWIVIIDGQPTEFAVEPNDVVINRLRIGTGTDIVVIEEVQPYGITGKEILRTVRWTGAFAEAAFPARVAWRTRHMVLLHICGSIRAKDGDVRSTLIDRWGGPGAEKKGGPLYGMKAHIWQAFAVGITYHDKPDDE